MLYDASRLLQPESHHFRPEWWREQGVLRGEAAGRGSAYFLDAGDDNWVLRHFRRGGMVGRLVYDRYLFTGLARSRPFREARLLAWMRSRKLPVPPPVAARVLLHGPFYRGDLITVRVSGRPLSRVALAAGPDPQLMGKLGALLRRFHDHGVFHADLNAHNILVADDGFHLIDFDRGGIRRPGRWRYRNLARLQRSLKKILAERWQSEAGWDAAWLSLEKAYSETDTSDTP